MNSGVASVVTLPLALILAGAASAQRPDAAAQQAVLESRIDFAEPPFPLPAALRDSIRFGWLEVPQDHAARDAGTFRLAVVILPARVATPEPDPIVFIPGGPASSLIESQTVQFARSRRIDLYRERRAFVLLEPRGHGLSEPRTCPELDGATPLVDGDSAAERILAAKLAACRTRLVSAGVRLETLSSEQAAHDLEWLRRALDAPTLNLIGSSYGTRIAAEAMRTVPPAIRAVAMDGPVPPGVPHLADDAETAAEVTAVLLERCVTMATCRAVYPELEAEYDIVLARVRREPLVVAVPSSDRAPDGRLVVNEQLLRNGIAQLLLTPELAAGVPLLIHALARDGPEVLGAMAPRLIQLVETRDIAYGAHLAFHCNDASAQVTAPAWLHGRCVAWIGEGYGRANGERLLSDIPTLIQTGEFDPRTPPSYAQALARGLMRGHYVEMPWTGHSRPPDCAIRITRDFFDAPDRAPDTTCMSSVPPVRFVPDVVPSRWIRRAMGADAHALTLAAPAGLAFVLLIVPHIVLPARARRLRRAGLPPVPGRGTLVIRVATAAGLLCLIATAAALYVGARTHSFVPALGVLEPWRWVLPLPWLVLGLGVIAAVRSARADEQRLPAHARWSAFAGIAIVIGTWAFHALG